jgi:hypothetical protein
MNTIKFCLLFTILFLLFDNLSQAQARYGLEPSIVDLRLDMSPSELIAVWGAPLQKTEQEAKRQEIWEYPEYSITFKEGKLSDITNKFGQSALKPVEVEENIDDLPEPIEPEEKVYPVEDILNEIIGKTNPKTN